jgi:molecular chaperone IbpA
MRSFDFSPLFRATVGFDRVFDLLDTVGNDGPAANGYPPYNIEKLGENSYRITMAVAGFGEGDLSIVQQENGLTVAGKLQDRGEGAPQYLHRGIAARAFERKFELADFVKVSGARLSNGLLHIELEREVPEARKPRTIAITGESRPALQAAA